MHREEGGAMTNLNTSRIDRVEGGASSDLWEALGALDESEATQVLTELFVRYEQRRHTHAGDHECAFFFTTLATLIAQVRACNVSRR
jgi:hypothetical protein